ncbi:cache domain-containing protein [Psychrobium sp. 1_MG-2023]|uniref:bifunctional diguanylate cyclase/phosphodiesterase n=1 Tax=Psychrobium sp. 1_MG-2023 TaxID=3062624 RepID=UPI000C33139C|nr:cache domain-containing protein [Psychrobium sp. 1_MG-2023]MDP2559653.1 cache domain-containing protein [Psychrobium sp. 1_MG-2023]PKF59484.1 histidine kinase [Alteromonadales bacterium alter-6D02]
MHVVQDNKLLKLIKIVPPLIVITFAILTNAFLIKDNQSQLAQDLATLQQDFIETEKSVIKARVIQLKKQISYERSSTETLLKEDIKQRIYQAHQIASNIYQNNSHLPEKQIVEMVKDALRDIRFNQGRGYYFIYTISGKNILHPVLPHIEGLEQWDFQDVRGNYITRDMGDIISRNGEGYYRWWFVKPLNKHQEFEKIGFGKYFAPLGWYIGTGEYLVDVENDIKQRLLKRIDKMNERNDEYMFIFNQKGQVLSHANSAYHGTNRLNVRDENNVSLVERLLSVAESNSSGGFLQYMASLQPSTGLPAEKISYVTKLDKWDWIIGSGTYLNDIKAYILQRERVVTEQNRQSLNKLLFLGLVVTLFFVILSFVVANYLAQRFGDYEERISQDFNELNKVKELLEHQALHDTLTKLPNRVSLDRQIKKGIERSKATDSNLAVMFVDLDDFKKINDRYGHSVGDKLLEVLGEQFEGLLAEGDTVARFGGDEFIFCFPDLTTYAQAERKVDLIREVFTRKFAIDGKVIYSTCSVGVAMYPDDGDDPELLISKADIVLYKSKSTKKGHFLFFNPEINTQVQRDLLLESELRSAVIKQELSVLYQPQIEVSSGKIQGVEALVRWHNESLGHVSPAEFIQVAEDIDIISQIGFFVIEQSLQDIMTYNQGVKEPLQLSINISPKQLMEESFSQKLFDLTNRVGVDRSLITLELTENALISDLNKVRPILQTLRDSGFKLSLDDFGTGYSSLSYLSNLPMNEIKIDRTFIDKFLTNKQSESLVKTIIAIGDFCDLAVVAEGVETHEQYERLQQYQCHLIQGYYFDRPLSLNHLIENYQRQKVNLS